MARAGYGSATHIYSMLGECAPFLIEGSRRGLKVVSEVYIPLSTERLLAQERRDFPDWEPDVPDFAAIRRQALQEDVLLTRSDHFICPSPAVQDDLVANFGISRDRTSLVPYGVHRDWLSVEARPERGRILFVGEPNLRKGIHYFGMAVERLIASGYRYQFRVAGEVTRRGRATTALSKPRLSRPRAPRRASTRSSPRRTCSCCLRSPRARQRRPTRRSRRACPWSPRRQLGPWCATASKGGSLPERDPFALADAIAEIVEDRDKRARMSVAARERARDYTWERYGERLVGALRSLRAVDEASTNELSKTHVIPGCSKAKSRRDES